MSRRLRGGPGSLLILIPCFNEQGAIGHVVRDVHRVLPGVPVMVIDDCSADSTIDVAEQAGASVLPLPHHLGLGGAVQAGYRLAFELGFQYVIRVDGDGQHSAEDIPRVFEVLRRSGVQMVIGSRYVRKQSRNYTNTLRGFGIVVFRTLLRPILGRWVYDPTSGFVGVNREALQVFSRSFPLEYPEIEALVVLQRKQFRFEEVPCEVRPRLAGVSTITAARSIYYILHVLLGVFVNVLKFEGGRRRRETSLYQLRTTLEEEAPEPEEPEQAFQPEPEPERGALS
ncbi:MAG: glycosyltransferase family 2 protein [Bryobacteraceae bacterium]|nr:glycosyltransferase family 2 protein [Bryobacteraceae bacterium]